MAKLKGLASRFRATMDQIEEEAQAAERLESVLAAERKLAEAEAKKLAEAARAARSELVGELADFGSDLGRVDVTRKGDRLVFSRERRTLTFSPEGDEDRVAVVFKGSKGVYLQRDDEQEWELILPEVGLDEARRLPLVIGLEELLVAGLGLPRPRFVPAAAAPKKTKKEKKKAASVKVQNPVKPKGPTPGSGLSDQKGPLD